MAETKVFNYVSKENLSYYDEKLKAYITNKDLAVLEQAQKAATDAANGKDTAIADAKKAGTDAQATADAAKAAAEQAQKEVDALEVLVGTLPEDATATDVVGYVNEKVSKITTDADSLKGRVEKNEGDIAEIKADYLKAADKEELQTQITSNKTALDKLNGTGEGSVDKKINDAFNDFATKVSDDDVVNSYKELIDWAATHGAEATEFAAGIKKNETAIADLEKLVGKLPEGTDATTVVELITKTVETEKERATAAEEGLAERILNLEGTVGTGGSVSEKIETAKNEAIAAANAHTDAEVKKDRDRLTTAEGEIDALQAELAAGGATKTAIETAQTTADAAKEAAAKAQGDVDTVKKTVEGNTTSIGNVEKRVSTAEDKVTALEGKMTAVETKAAANETNIVGLTTRMAAVEEVAHTHVAMTNTEIDALFA